nr:hypothetical protein [Nostoc sp. PA-18-2419]
MYRAALKMWHSRSISPNFPYRACLALKAAKPERCFNPPAVPGQPALG